MYIDELKSTDIENYNALALTYGSIFDTTHWTKLFRVNIKCYGIFNTGGQLIGGFSLYKENKLFISCYRNPPFTPAIGPFLKVDASNAVSITSTWKDALTIMAEFVDNLMSSVISLSLSTHILDTQPFIWKKFKVVPGYTYLLDLSITADEMLQRMSGERRKNITKGNKDGLIVKKSDEYEITKSLVMKTFSRQEKRINEYYLNKILFEFAGADNSFGFVTYHNNNPIACTFCIYDRDTAYYLLGGYNHTIKHHGAGALAMWEAIKYAKGLGLQYFDFEGSMVPQIERYFRGFGGTLTPSYRINKAKLPIEILLKFFKRELF